MAATIGNMAATTENMAAPMMGGAAVGGAMAMAAALWALRRGRGDGGGGTRRQRARPAGTVQLNCWFCSADADVVVPPAATHPQWTCGACGSYNGFSEDGDYDQPIGRCATSDAAPPAPVFAERGLFQEKSVLCATCNHHQQLIVALVAGFEPTSEVRPPGPRRASRAQSSGAERVRPAGAAAFCGAPGDGA